MVNRNYVKGRAFEYQVKHAKEKDGFYVIRSAGSKGAIDLICFKCVITHEDPKPGEFMLRQFGWIIQVIQCKVYGKKTTKPLRTDLELLKQVSVPESWQRVLAWRVNGESGFKEEIV